MDILQSHKEEKLSNAMGKGGEGTCMALIMHTAGLGFARFLCIIGSQGENQEQSKGC